MMILFVFLLYIGIAYVAIRLAKLSQLREKMQKFIVIPILLKTMN